MDSKTPILDEILEESMNEVVITLREVLKNVQEEKVALMNGYCMQMQTILSERSKLVDELEQKRLSMSSILCRMLENSPLTECAGLENLSELVGEDKISLLLLRDQILALTNSLESQTKQNVYLCTQKILLKPKIKSLALVLLDPLTECDVEECM